MLLLIVREGINNPCMKHPSPVYITYYIKYLPLNQLKRKKHYVKILAEIGFWARTGNRHGFVLNSFAVA